MNKRVLVRFICLLVFAGIIGFLTAHDVLYKHTLGREHYLAAQAAYFDKNIVPLTDLGFSAFTCALIFVIPFALYQGLVFVVELLFGLRRVISPVTSIPPSSPS